MRTSGETLSAYTTDIVSQFFDNVNKYSTSRPKLVDIKYLALDRNMLPSFDFNGDTN